MKYESLILGDFGARNFLSVKYVKTSKKPRIGEALYKKNKFSFGEPHTTPFANTIARVIKGNLGSRYRYVKLTNDYINTLGY